MLYRALEELSRSYLQNHPKLYLSISRLQKEIHSYSGQYPSCFYLYHRLRHWRLGLTVNQQTDFVIEGYPSSANTFAVAAFRFAQSRNFRLAHHTHVPVQVIRAIKWKIPTLVLIRKPLDLIPSAVTRLYPFYNISVNSCIRQVIRHYCKFYNSLLPYRNEYVIGEFEEVTTNYGHVIQKVNNHYNTDFVPFKHTASNILLCFRTVGKARPNDDRENAKHIVREELKSKQFETLFENAESTYSAITNVS
jgi:hypothetical protein